MSTWVSLSALSSLGTKPGHGKDRAELARQSVADLVTSWWDPQRETISTAGDLDGLFEELAEAMNAAQPGRIIADSEEPVRDAHSD